MSYFEAVLLGIVQGLTEFLPVSSSGHLVLTEALLEVKQPGVAFEVVVHLGTLLSVLVYFRKQVLSLIAALFDSKKHEERRLIVFLIAGTIPAVVFGLLFKDSIESAFGAPMLAGVMLIVTGLILISTRFVRGGLERLNLPRSLLIGVGQALAIMPGISRSGSTIATGLLVGVEPGKAAEFSFLLAIPAIAGAAVLSLGDLEALPTELIGPYLVAALTAFAVALVAVYIVMETVRRGRLHYFAYYCFAAGAAALYLFA